MEIRPQMTASFRFTQEAARKFKAFLAHVEMSQKRPPKNINEADIARHGPMAVATEQLAHRVRAGERLILMCWCHGAPFNKPCHGDLIKARIERLLGFSCD